jgi:ribosome-binding protein aMBF1 (putative translation factor)
MTSANAVPYEVQQSLRKLGSDIKTARLRRRLGQPELAAAAGVSARTVRRLESGDDGVAVGSVLAVLWGLGLLSTVQAVANPDQDDHGKILEQSRLPKRVRQRALELDNDF